MAASLFQQLFRRVNRLAGPDAVSDAALLDDYLARRDQKAFELLVWRHGPMVLQTCRRILRHDHDSEDAFQAVFWVLARKAGSIRRRDTLPGWLHRVAVRVALAAQQRRRDLPSLQEVAEPVPPPAEPNSALGLLDEELCRLPVMYRLPIVLCHLEQRSTLEAADELGIPQGTLFSRLARGREKLRQRLQRRGVALGIGASWVLEQAIPAATACGTPLVEKTVTGALAFVAARGAEVSKPVLVLTKGVLHAMWIRNVVLVSLAAVGVGSLATGAWITLQPAAAQDQAPLVAQELPKAGKLQKLLKDRYESAAKAYDALWDQYVTGKTAVPDRCYQWSLKTLEAEREWKPAERAKSQLAHRDRMTEFHKLTKAKYDVGAIGVAEYHITEQALLEAQLWVEREKVKK